MKNQAVDPLAPWQQGPLSAIDLFCGAGGLTEGLRQAGFSVIGAIDNEPLAVETYKANHSKTKVWEIDIKKMAASRLMRELALGKGELDLLAGCPPCQGFSSMRTLNGSKDIHDSRNDLVFHFLRFVRVLRPKAIMMENVPALADDWRIERMLEDLGKLGYKANVKILNAADFGVPQRRRRMILLGSKNGTLDVPRKADSVRTVRDVIADLEKPGNSDDPLHDFGEKRSERISDLIKKIPKDGGSRTDLHPDLQLPCHKKCNGFKDVYGRMAWDDVAPTITSGCTNPSKGRFLHPVQNRAITLREAALLQSFRYDYYFSLRKGKQPAAVLIGNALPPELIRRQGEAIRKHFPENENHAIGVGANSKN